MSSWFGRSVTHERLLEWAIILLVCNLVLTTVTIALLVDKSLTL